MVTETPPSNGSATGTPPTTGVPAAGVRPVTTVTAGTLIMDTYEIEKLINSGGMGEVYRGRNIHNGEPVAIKIVLPSLAHDPKIVALFQKESTVLSRLNHDAIVRYHTFTIDRSIGRPCMVMEFVSGTPLGDRVEQGPMPLEDVKTMFRRIAGGLDKAHRAGVVHRDLSPDNVILEEGTVEHAKLIDFGIAKSTNIGGGTLLGGQFAGKFNWVSPEQLGAFGGHVDGRSDIYSTALLIAAASRGEVVPMGASIVDAVGKRAGVPDLTGVAPELLPLLSYMLQPDPANRPETMAAVIAALDNPSLIPSAVVEPPPLDPNRTVIGGALPIQPSLPGGVVTAGPLAAPSAMPVAASLPPVRPVSAPPATSDWGVPGQTSSPATIISVQPLPPAAEPEDISPFGAPSQPASATAKPAAVAYDPLPVAKKGNGGLIAVLGVLLVAAGAGGAVLTGAVDPAALFGGAQTPEEQAAEQAADEAARVAEQEAAAAAEAEAAAKAEAEAAAKAEADAAAAAQAEANAAAAKLAEEAAAAEAEAARVAAAAEAETQAAAQSSAEEQAAVDAARQAEAEAAAKAAQEAEAAQAAEAARLAEEQAAAERAVQENAARLQAEADAAANADPLTKQLAWIDGFIAPACVHVRLASSTATGVRLDGFATSTAPLEAAGADYKAKVGTDADMALRLINDTQCSILDFANQTQIAAKDSPLIRMDNTNEAIKSGETVSGVIEGIKGRSFALLLVSEEGVTSTLSPYVTQESDGTARFRLALKLPEGRPSAPHLLLAVITDAELAVLGQLDPVKTYSATLLMPFLTKKLQDEGVKAQTALGFFRLEN